MSPEFNKAFGLENEVAVITGGGTGLGFAMAKCMIAAGAKVVITGRREDVLQNAVRELGDMASYRVYDVTNADEAPEFVES